MHSIESFNCIMDNSLIIQSQQLGVAEVYDVKTMSKKNVFFKKFFCEYFPYFSEILAVFLAVKFADQPIFGISDHFHPYKLIFFQFFCLFFEVDLKISFASTVGRLITVFG